MRLRRIAAGSLGLCLCVAIQAQMQESPRLAPAEYRSHFAPNEGAAADSGSRDGWESYPLVEDAGYDPTIQAETTHGKSALWRVAAPTQDGRFQLGIIKRLRMVAGQSASLRVQVRVQGPTASNSVYVALFRGTHEERRTAVVTADVWHELVFNLSASPDAITAVAIGTEFPHAVRGRLERFAVADVRLTALATRHLTVQEPSALWDVSRSLYYFKRAIKPGEDLHVMLSAHDDMTVHWTFASPDGAIKARGNGVEARHHFALDDEPGVWTLHVTSGITDTTALLLLRPSQPKGLLFDQAPPLTPKLLQSVHRRRDLLRATVHPEAGANIARMNADSMLPGLPSYFSILMQAPELAMLDAIDFRSTGDPSARDESRTLLREIARWPLWVHPWFPAHGYHSYYPVGMMTKFVVMAEEFLGEDLPKDARAQLDQALLNLSIKPIFEEYVIEDRLQFNTSNWIGNTVGGAMLAALASDNPDTAGYALGLYAKERDHVREAYTSDGSYGEGTSYQRFDLEMTTLTAAAAKRLLGQSLDRDLMPADRYLRYATYGRDGFLDYGDSHLDLRPSNVFAYLASLNQSARLTDFYFRYRDEGTAELLSRVLWEGSIHPVDAPPSTEPSSQLFAQRGIAVLRDDWSPEASVIAMRAGRNFNHNHADEGSIFFARWGKLWLGEAGYADYYKDPAYATFNIQAVGHNTLLIDGDPESQIIPGNAAFGLSPSFTHSLIGQQASLLQADLAPAYAARLTGYTRTLFFQKDGSLVVIDQVKSDSPHIYTQVWHPKQRIDAVETEQSSFRLGDDSHHVLVEAFANAALSTARLESPLPLASYEKAEHEAIERPERFEIATRAPAKTATIVTLIQPQDHANVHRATWKQEDSSKVLALGNGGVAIEDHGPGIVAWWTNGALALRVTHYRDRVTGGTLRATRPVDMQVTRGEDGKIALEVDATDATTLSLDGFAPVCDVPCAARRTILLHTGHTSLTLRDDPHR
jgi:hypothetical protein